MLWGRELILIWSTGGEMNLKRSSCFAVSVITIQIVCSIAGACLAQSQSGSGYVNNAGLPSQSPGTASDDNPYYKFFHDANSQRSGPPRFVQKWNPAASNPNQLPQSNQSGFYGNFDTPMNTPQQVNSNPQIQIYQNRQGSAGAPVRGGYDPRWNPNYGTGPGGMQVTAQAGKFTQMMRSEFPLPANSDETQMFQVNDFAARANGSLQSRRGHP